MTMKPSEEHKTPQITCRTDGPYVLNDFIPRTVDYVQNAHGDQYSRTVGVSLCRCGGSKSKPFCDGEHRNIGFTDENTADPALNKRKDYVGQKITIHYNRALCSASENCVKGLPSVFKSDGDPWIFPDADDVEKIIETVKKCPSAALSYSLDGVEYRDQDRSPMMIVSANGPYEVVGGIELVDPPELCEGASTEHYALCRCGASKNKPFCDGSHWDIDFRAE